MIQQTGHNRKIMEKEPYYLTTKTESFRKTLKFCEKVAASNVNILLTGESGTGKEVLARHIHNLSARRNGNFIAINCSAFSDSLLESELFGHEQGAFTGATSVKKGKFEYSEGGTFFLDEVGDMSLTTQLKLLRVLETKAMERIGSNDLITIDFRLISATHQDLKYLVQHDLFREDFFYRISTVVIDVPPLRERREDLEDLIDFFLVKSEAENNIEIHSIEPRVKEFLLGYDYCGNIRELKNIIDRMVVLSENGTITTDGLPVLFSFGKSHLPQRDGGSFSFQEIIPFHEFKRQSEKEYLEWVLLQTGGNVAEASRHLQMSTRQLFSKIKDLAIKK